jgi:hypothetical protein
LRSLTSKEWQRFEAYAPLVRHLSDTVIQLGSYSTILEGNIHLREKPRRERALLPNVTHLDAFPACQEDLRVLMCLLSRRLISLKVTFSYIEELRNEDTVFPQSSDCVRLVEEIMSTSPNLTHLELFRGYDIADPFTSSQVGGAIFSAFLGSQSTLQRLGMMLGIFQQLLYNPPPPMLQLRELDLRGNDFRSMPRPGLPGSLQFPALRKLSGNLPPSSRHLWVPLVSAVGKTIEDIKFNVDGDGDDASANIESVDIVEVIAVIGASCPSLKSLYIYGNLVGEGTFPLGFLRPMLNCTQITDLCIMSFDEEFDFSLYVSEEDVKSMALAWPDITELLLGQGYASSVDMTESIPTLSPSGLQALCSQCSRLSSVRLTVDLTVIPATPIRRSSTNATPLDQLHFGGSTIKDPYAVSKWIGDACVAHGIQAARQDILWAQVRNTVALLQELRNEVEMKYTDEIKKLRQENESLRAGKE